MAGDQRYTLGSEAVRQIRELVRAEMIRQHPVLRERGRWNKKGGGSGAEIIRFTIDSADCEADPKSASVNVDAIICNAASVAVDDTVTVVDPNDCHFNEPEAELVGRKGYAVKLDDGTNGCRWEVIDLCCLTDECA